MVGAIEVGSKGNHNITLLPDGSKLYSENEDQAPFVSVLDPRARRRIAEVPIPRGALGLCASADGRRVLVADGGQPALLVIETQSDTLVETVPLNGYAHPAQWVRCSPDGRFVVVTADEEPLATVLDGSLTRQSTFEAAPGPMGIAFHPDGRTALVANHGAGRITIVDLEAGRRPATSRPAVGVETLAFTSGAPGRAGRGRQRRSLRRSCRSLARSGTVGPTTANSSRMPTIRMRVGLLERQQLGHRAAQPAGEVVLLGGDDAAGLGGGLQDGVAIERLDGVHVEDAGADAFGLRARPTPAPPARPCSRRR